MKSIQGMITAMVTCFKADGSLDIPAMRESTRFQIQNGAAGLCPLGGTGEPLSLTQDEQKAVIDAVVEEAAGRVPVVVGCLVANQNDIIAAGRHARKAGADAIMVIPPYFVNTKHAHTRQHFEAIADACDIPMMLFHGPSRSGVRLDADTILSLIDHVPHFFAIKETSGDITIVAELLRSAPKRFAVLQGLEELLLPTLALGGHGAVLSLGCLMPSLLHELQSTFEAGNLERAREIQLSLLPLCRAVYSEPNPGPLKYALAFAGRNCGPTRTPIYEPSRETKTALDELLPAFIKADSSAAGTKNAA
jgi:4-hydroxy-tetrahydrodipicolinate synthase